MSRFVYILSALLVPACAASTSGVRSSPDRAASGKATGSTSAETSPVPARDVGPQSQPPEEEVPEWLKKKPPGDPSLREFRDRMAKEHREFLQLFNDEAARIDFSDGIDVSEAEFIGRAYFAMEFGACGVTEKAGDGGAQWLIRPRVGATGHPMTDFIRIDKRTGTARYGSGPTTEGKEVIEYKRRILQENVERFSNRGAVQ
jgi:hypothetical protein